MEASDEDPQTARAALGYRFAVAAAALREDRAAVELLTEQSLADTGLDALLDAGTLSIAEQLRDVAECRQIPAPTLLDVLVAAHAGMIGATTTNVLAGAGAYLRSPRGVARV